MKDRKNFAGAILLFGLVMVLLIQPMAAYARDSFTVRFENPVLVRGSRVDPGSYEIQCISGSSDALVKILKGNKTVVEAQGRWVEKGVKASDTIIITEQVPEGKILKEIQLKGKTRAIVLE